MPLPKPRPAPRPVLPSYSASRATNRDGVSSRAGPDLVWDQVGMARNREGLETAIAQIQDLRSEFWQNLKIPGDANT
jgi:succinate dehydrogenase/fumarate reductase flavoprotein subunit